MAQQDAKRVRSRRPAREMLPLSPDLAARSTHKDRLYLELRQALMYGEFAPGLTVTVRSLSERLQAGIMPVRDAVQRLVAERALELRPSGRLRVPSLSTDEVVDLFDLRLVLESHAARRAARQSSPESIADARAAMVRLESAESEGMAGASLLAANFRFHFSIYAAAGSMQLTRMIEGLWLRFGPLLIELINSPGSSAYMADEHQLHRRLMTAIELGDPEFAASAMRAIIECTREAILDGASRPAVPGARGQKSDLP